MVLLSRSFHFPFTVYIAVLQPLRGLNHIGLGYSPFARHYLGNHFCFLFLRVLRCFSSPGLRFRDTPSVYQVSPFGNLRVKGYSAPYRSLSQPITSFIAYKSQGILHTPLSNFLTKICFTLICGSSCILYQYVKERCANDSRY